MQSNRLEAFSDGVIAIVIMVLEMKVPHGADFGVLRPLLPVFLSYVLSFVYLLFWLSLLPFSTGWLGENHFQRGPTVVYGVNLLCCAIAYFLLQTSIIRLQGKQGVLAVATMLWFIPARRMERATERP